MTRIRVALHRRIVGRVVSDLGILAIAVGFLNGSFLLLCSEALVLGVLDERNYSVPIWVWGILVVQFLVCAGSRAVITRGRQLQMAGSRLRQATGEEVLAAGVEFILLLRSFEADSARHRDESFIGRAARLIDGSSPWSVDAYTYGRGLSTSLVGPPLEAPLVSALAELHPVVAVGRPGERLPALGASRLYLGPNTWQQEVEQLIARAKLVVMIAGDSQGLIWELQTTLQAGALAKLVIFVPIDFTEPSSGNCRWQLFRLVLLETLPVDESELPEEFLTDVMIRWAYVDGQPRVLIVRPTYDAGVTELRGSLRDAAREFAFKQRPLDLRAMLHSLLESEPSGKTRAPVGQ